MSQLFMSHLLHDMENVNVITHPKCQEHQRCVTPRAFTVELHGCQRVTVAGHTHPGLATCCMSETSMVGDDDDDREDDACCIQM
jgi:hypothetical protein